MAQGTIKRYDFRKGFGFITDDKSGEEFFFHKSEWQGDGPIRQGIAVNFVGKESDKGPQADSVIPLNATCKAASNKSTATKPASLEDRVASLESALSTWKILSLLALVGVAALAVDKFVI